MPTLGGAAQRILGNASSVRVSPDGRRMAYVKYVRDAQQNYVTAMSLCTAGTDGVREQCVATKTPPKEVFTRVAWSPESRSVAALAILRTGLPSSASILIYDLANGSSRTLRLARFSFRGLTWPGFRTASSW